MRFKKFSSLENSYRQNLIDKVVEHGYSVDTEQWIVTEKLHGTNLSFWCDGEEVRVASRSQFVDGTFYNCQAVIDRYADKLLDWCKRSSIFPITIYGELFGNGVQKEVKYGERDFAAFDVEIFNQGPLHKIAAANMCKDIGIPFVPVIFKGTFAECLSVDNTFQSLLTPEGYEEDNTAEGLVIEPVEPLFFANGSRIYFKNKTSSFSEKKNTSQKTPKSYALSEEENKILSDVLQYNTTNRVSNVISKIGSITNKDFGKILGLTVADMIEDYQKDSGIELKKALEDNWTHLNTLLNAEVGKTVREEFVKHLE